MKTFDRFIHGGDYNPNQWPKDVWENDMRLFDKASINSATINVFSWSTLQPREDIYDFEELDEIVEMLTNKNKAIVLGTSTAALPAWLFKKYPEVGRVDFEGRRHRFGQRHNACPNSLVYQKYVKELVSRIAKRYGEHESLVCWHINNEYGGTCYCENCEAAFRVWLQEKYKTLDALNKAWNFSFWGHTVHEWDEVVVPNILSEMLDEETPTFSGVALDYRRFMSDSLLANFKLERDTIRKFDKHVPITTNLMGTYKGLDSFKWAKEMDIVSWDNYPAYDTPWSLVAMTHDLMRGLKNKPFMLMEQTPSQQNWQPYNSLKRPGQMRAQSYQSIAHGADTIQYFQLRRSVGGCEKFHGAVIGHAGHEETRVFREVSQLGEELADIGKEILTSENKSRVGVLFDWDNFWALEYTSGPNVDLTYVEQIYHYYEYFYNNHISVDMIQKSSDFSNYDVIVAPVLYMLSEEEAHQIETFVANGGHFVTSFMSGIVDKTDNVHLGGYPGPLRKISGIWVEEIDALAPEQSQGVKLFSGEVGKATKLCDVIHLEGAKSIGNYTSDFYEGMPAVTKNNWEKGSVWYVGTELDKELLANVLDELVQELEIARTIESSSELEVTCREDDNHKWYFMMNFTKQQQVLPKEFIGETDELTKEVLSKDKAIQPFDTILIKRRK